MCLNVCITRPPRALRLASSRDLGASNSSLTGAERVKGENSAVRFGNTLCHRKIEDQKTVQDFPKTEKTKVEIAKSTLRPRGTR